MTLQLTAVEGIGEVTPGTDLSELIASHPDLRDGDVVVVTSKIVSKAAGLATDRPKNEVVAEGTDRVVAQRDATRIVRTHHGLTLAAAGVDASNTEAGTALPLPADPDADARAIRSELLQRLNIRVAVVISDTAGRAWRIGQTDIAIGCAGVLPFESFVGRADSHGNLLAVTAPAVADEIASAADLVSGKLGGQPVVVLRGLPAHLLTAGDGPGASALIRAEDGDLFGLGSREAVMAALTGQPQRGFPDAADTTVDDVVALAKPADLQIDIMDSHVLVRARVDQLVEAGAFVQRVEAIAVAHQLEVDVTVEQTS